MLLLRLLLLLLLVLVMVLLAVAVAVTVPLEKMVTVMRVVTVLKTMAGSDVTEDDAVAYMMAVMMIITIMSRQEIVWVGPR